MEWRPAPNQEEDKSSSGAEESKHASIHSQIKDLFIHFSCSLGGEPFRSGFAAHQPINKLIIDLLPPPLSFQFTLHCV